jgi:hypothetical protein
MALSTVVLAVPLFLSRGGGFHFAGRSVVASLAVAPSDRHALACALDRPIGQRRCAYRSDTGAAPAVEPRDLIQPFVTSEGETLLVAGFFEMPPIATRLVRQYSNARFTARCKLRLVEQVKDVRVRLHPAEPWSSPDEPLWMAEPESCRIQ